MYRTIVVGLDGSPRQNAVLKHAIDVADALGGQLLLCRAMQIPLSIPAVAWSVAGDDFGKFLVDHGTDALVRMAQELPEGLVKGTECRLGSPSDVICEVARETGAGLVVIGSHGYDRIERFLGTTASRVTNLSPCNVLVVKNEHDEP